MKFILALSALVASAAAFPHLPGARVEKRASASDKCTIGYCTQNGGTSGGAGGTTTTVSSLAALQTAVSGTAKKVVYISGTISGSAVANVGSNTTVLGKSGAKLSGVGLRVLNSSNVIIRGITISKVLASAGDAIGIQASKNVWVDHCDLSSDMTHDKDYYDGLLDITHGCDWISVTYTKMHDHWKCSLVGHSDNNGSEDSGHLTVTYYANYWYNINSRTPSYRFGTGHFYNNYLTSVADGINSRDGAKILVQNNVFASSSKPCYSTDAGYVQASGNDFGGASNTALATTGMSMPYSYSLTATASVKSMVQSNAGVIAF